MRQRPSCSLGCARMRLVASKQRPGIAVVVIGRQRAIQCEWCGEGILGLSDRYGKVGMLEETH